MTRILLVDDEAAIRRGVRRFLEHQGFAVALAEDLASARRQASGGDFDLLLADLRLPDGEGTALIGEFPQLPTVIMTSYASVPSAVEAMKSGAIDYIAKPFDHDALLLTLRAALRSSEQSQERPASAPESAEDCGLIGQTSGITTLRKQIHRIAAADSTVLIRGESGTGKEVAARAIHTLSPRADRPFVPVNCASIPEGLVEAELFGHAQGAYTGAVKARAGLVESAHGGVLFLDEIGELAPAAQARLLRVLQEGEIRPVGANQARHVDVRLLAATHRDLEAMIEAGEFRADLYYRLRVLEIRIPPLRERMEDLPLLAGRFLDELGARFDKPGVVLSDEAVARMMQYSWPGNVRELKNALERAVVLSEGSRIDWEHLGLATSAAEPRGQPGSLNEYFRRFVLENQGRMNETQLAQALGISRKTLWERRQRENLPRPSHQ
ncbi:sigma-54-dependent transcriptional regulator [Thioalkalivibrio sp.]|uniref:sigma-54-dependent transcriptional regulator n=1 Tax=Thioalkalivibrio sp. TaxID=2093813 RepID=UPI003974E51F